MRSHGLATSSTPKSDELDATSHASTERSGRSYSYAPSHRVLEIVAMIAGTTMLLITLAAVVRVLPSSGAGKALLFVALGLCLADLISGLVHWAADTYGSETMPVFGGFVRTFREHHVLPLKITQHDFVETNGDVFIFSSPVYFVLLLFVEDPFALSTIFGVFLGSYTNSQIHKWAHLAKRPLWVTALQRTRLFLSADHHSLHHRGAHKTHYCITTGWMNSLLDSVRFFRALEWLLLRVGIRRTNIAE